MPIEDALLRVPAEDRARFLARAELAAERARAALASSTEIELAIWVLCALSGGASGQVRGPTGAT